MRERKWLFVLVALVLAALISPAAAEAYGGPGSVISGVGALLAVVAAIGASLFGFVWFPLKRLLRRINERGRTVEKTPIDSGSRREST